MTGPDHLMSLGPVALKERVAAWCVSLVWSIGHALGTSLLVLPLLVLSRSFHVPTIAALGARLAGIALIGMALWSFYLSRRAAAHQEAPRCKPLLVGLMHGVTGAGSLVLVLPMLVSGSLTKSLAFLAFLAAFAVGSTVAMA